MEDRSNIREVHGVDNARKIASASVEHSSTQRVTVTDGFGEVELRLATSSFPAGLTPEQAVMLSEQLVASANRIRAADVAQVSEANGSP